ncbi:MAG TPA: hypothetical protein VEH57_09615 [Thermoplasmata archaeon]|nr:hypothetical protein [Thermoplasmata archaeon]
MAIEKTDRELLGRVGAQKVVDARATLVALLEMDRNSRGPRGFHASQS